MNRLVKIFIMLVIFSGQTMASISPNRLQELSNNLRRSYEAYYFNIFDYVKKSQGDERFYFESFERTQIIRHTKIFLNSFSTLNQLMETNKFTRIDKRNIHGLALKALKYQWLTKFVDLTFTGGNGFVAVLSEDSLNLEYNGGNYRNIIKDLLHQARRSKGNSSQIGKQNSHKQIRNMVFIYDNFKEIQKLKLDKDLENIISLSLFEYAQSMDELSVKMKEIDYRAGSYSVFYFIKVAILKALSFVALPGQHKISLETLKKNDHLVQPGDIGIIQRYYKLSNLVFKGNWTHSLLYLGEYSKFKNYFDADPQTNSYYALKCFEQELDCTNYLSYLEIVFAKQMKIYQDGEKLKDPIVTIESLKPGVILFNMKKSMGWDNLAILRPKLLSRLDKARAIEKAFESLGKPYDYNFNGHTQERFVCTELISYAYESDPLTDKKGLTWEMNFVMEKPVMYAFDILETYFKRKSTHKQELSLVYYLKGERGEFGKSRFGSEEELLETVDIAD